MMKIRAKRQAAVYQEDRSLTVLIWLLKDWLLTKARMRARLKFIGDFRWHRSHGHTLRAAYFLARNTL